MKVLLIDDHPLILTALQKVIEGVGSEVSVVGVAGARAARAALAADAGFDLVLLDLSLGDADGFDVLAELRRDHPALPVVIVSASDRGADVIRAIDMGAMGFVPKRSSNETLQEALRVVMSGGVYVPQMAMSGDDEASRAGAAGHAHGVAGGAARPATPAGFRLTPRQADVLGLLLRGYSNKLIARELDLSVETVKDHVAAVLRSLGVNSRTQAVLVVSQMSSQGGAAAWPPRPTH
jgi:DNA-binding NarL/FixJ family response regulator